MKRTRHLGVALTALLAIGCATAPIAGQVDVGQRRGVAPAKPAAGLIDVLKTSDLAGYRLLAETRFPAPIASVTASSTRAEEWLDVSNVTDGRLTSAWGPADCDSDPTLTFYLEDLVTLDELGLKLSLGQLSSPSNQRVFVDVWTSDDGGTTWSLAASDLNPNETALGSFPLPPTQANAVRLSFSAPGEDICNLLVCYANFIDPITTWPSTSPSYWPSTAPSTQASVWPSTSSSAAPTSLPTDSPTNSPTNSPPNSPTNSPTTTPTNSPTSTPTDSPTSTPTSTPTGAPTSTPTSTPTNTPTNSPTSTPTNTPTAAPTSTPTSTPTPAIGTTGCGTYMSFTPGAWGAPPSGGGNAGTFLHDNWTAISAADGSADGQITLGVGPNVFTFTSAQAITDFLPASGGSSPIAASATNPTTGGSTLISHTTALKLEVLAYGPNGTNNLSQVFYTGGGPLDGYTIGDILLLSERYIGGDITTLPGGLQPADLIGIVASINLFFEPTGTPDGVTFSCPAD